MKLLFMNIILMVACVHRVELTIHCTTPDGLMGRCLRLHACKRLQAINNRPRALVTLYDYLLLIQSKCEARNHNLFCCPYAGNTLAPMTPMKCFTADGQYGTCTRINSCPSLNVVLREPVNNNNLGFISSLRCQGHDQLSVCCPSRPFREIDPRRFITPYEVNDAQINLDTINEDPIVPRAKCHLTSLPPDPESDCCGYQYADDDRIIGGSQTSIDQYPWLVLIEYEKISTKAKDVLCGGSLISGRYVLTAGHCVAGNVITEFTPVNVRLGEYDISNEGPDCIDAPGGGEDCTDEPLTLGIEEIIPHESYNKNDPSRNHDIALIRLNETAPYTDFIRPICLPTMDLTLDPPDEFIIYASGWGLIENTYGIRSNVKLAVELPYKSRSMCQQLFSRINVTISHRQFCAGGEKGRDTCKGDSGGPLMHSSGGRYDVIGVVSFGPKPCGQPNMPSVYTNVYEYLQWIRNNIEE